jgi:hypothetical protein
MKDREKLSKSYVESRAEKFLVCFTELLWKIPSYYFNSMICTHTPSGFVGETFSSSCFQINSLKTTSKNFHNEPQIFACFQSAKHFFFVSNFCAGLDGVWLVVTVGRSKSNCDYIRF